MICLSITPESRQLAKVDLLNAARQGDLIELCVDRLIKEPDFKDLLADRRKPVLVSCRRPEDGGGFKGTEDERTMRLRQAIVAGPDYIELDFDIAGSVPRFGQVKRVVSCTSLKRPLRDTDIEEVFEKAALYQADVIKFTWPTATLEAAWPLLATVSRKRGIPVVGLGLGPAGLAFSLLGRKYGSPWIYAALEKGMEAFPGQPTVTELDDTYRWREIDGQTRFVVIAGAGPGEQVASRVLNAGFDLLNRNLRCLPVQLSSAAQLPKMLEILKTQIVLALPQYGGKIFELCQHADESTKAEGYADLYLQQADGWHGFSDMRRRITRALAAAIGPQATENDMARKSVMIVGHGPMAQVLAKRLSVRQATVSLTSSDDDQASQAAGRLKVRFVPFAKLYDTYTDVLIVAETPRRGAQPIPINPAICRPDMVLLDISEMPVETTLADEARIRAAKVINPSPMFVEFLGQAFKSVTGQELPEAAFAQGLAE